jgi:hypothetical protein
LLNHFVQHLCDGEVSVAWFVNLNLRLRVSKPTVTYSRYKQKNI